MKKGCLITLGILVGFFVLLIIIALCLDDNASTNPSSQSTDSIPTQAESPKGKSLTSSWEYNSSTDPMTDEVTKIATICSDNSHQFAFPYEGGSYLSLSIRQKGQHKNVYIRISKGQFISNISGGSIIVRFDDEQPVTFATSLPSDYSSDLLFIQNTNTFIRKCQTARRIKIQTEFYQEGSRVFEFFTEIPFSFD